MSVWTGFIRLSSAVLGKNCWWYSPLLQQIPYRHILHIVDWLSFCAGCFVCYPPSCSQPRFYIWSWVENCKRWSDTTDIKPLACCTSRAFLFLDTTSFVALNDLSHSDVDTGIESSKVLIFYWYGVPMRFFFTGSDQQGFNFYWYCVPVRTSPTTALRLR
jgi:hypothetical protein